MQKLSIKTSSFSGNTVFFREDGAFSILDNSSSLPEGFSCGAEIPIESGTYLVTLSFGTFLIKVLDTGTVAVVTSFLITDGVLTGQKVFSYEDSTLTEVHDYGTQFAGEYRVSRTTDGGFALAGFPASSTLLHLIKEGEDGDYVQTVDVAGLVGAQTFSINGSRHVLGLVTDESGWYVHVYNNSSTTGVRPAFIIYVGFDGQNNNYIYTGRNHTLGTIPAETYTSNSFGNKMIASPDGGLILLIGRPFNGTHLAKFDSDLTLLYHSADLATRPGYVGEDASVIELDIFLSSVVSGGQGKYYLAGVADIFDGTYEAIDFMVEAEDTGTFFTDNGYSEILAVPAVNGGSGYADIADGFYSDGKIYWCGTIYDEPETSGSNYGRVILRVDADSKDVDWVVRDYTDTVDGLNDLYHVFVLGERVYVAGVTGDTSILRNSVYVYSSEDGSFIEGIFPSDYSPTLSKESSIL